MSDVQFSHNARNNFFIDKIRLFFLPTKGMKDATAVRVAGWGNFSKQPHVVALTHKDARDISVTESKNLKWRALR